MGIKTYAQAAANWAVSMVGCEYSQAKRLQDGAFDCSSLVARAYKALGKRWKHGGSVPISMYEVYDDGFELLWPENYADIGKKLGGKEQIALARQAGDLQFLCTDKETKRANRITHVAMVAGAEEIVHARGTKYGVRMDDIDLYAGKVCALTRYNPVGALRIGMCGWRTLALQKALNECGADLSEDGEFGEKTQKEVMLYQTQNGMAATGIADEEMLSRLNLYTDQSDVKPGKENSAECIRVTGRTVNLRKGPGTEYGSAGIAEKGEVFAVADFEGWKPVRTASGISWISEKYCEAVA